ncbi:MAG: NADP-binding protein [Candidatus Wallbacteria bacterium HGW-Wallbacteria-1]|jgi:4-hydroxy-tetrahydrodipicolinate reductase|uniref:NADP-binding protein n=1 Tax=Candidatus Wallbacteria bacterium HGW-Wallbacteria-1 TaxID=2013854 RepID=A0A2N1PLN4_9BACT|nr:MAG: NADP-binding protein [Candidatus Wallbacteria bacterium HGW-Wallbacteria-1]
MKKIRVGVVGLGAMGSGIARLITEKSCLELAAAMDMRPEYAGKDIADVLELDRPTGVRVTNDLSELLDPDRIDIAIHATSSFTKEVFPQLKLTLERGINCISIAEEMACPEISNPDLAAELDRVANERGVTILGTGVNPGFVLDLLIVTLTGVCFDVERIEARRVNDLSPFGTTVMQTQGVGTTVEEFNKGIAENTIFGHIGFKESITMIASALGWRLDEIREVKEPIVSNTYRKTKYAEVHPGMVAGCNHIGMGFMGGKEVIRLEHPQQILPELENVDTGDFVKVIGNPGINVANVPEIPGGKGTIGIAVNMIPQVIMSSPGLKRMIDLPVPSALPRGLAEFRRM